MTAAATDALERFLARVAAEVAQGTAHKLVLARYEGAEPELERLTGRPVLLRGQPHWSFVWRYRTRDITKNLPATEVARALRAWIAQGFRNAHLFTPTQEVQLAYSRKGKASLRSGRLHGAGVEAPAPAEHNRQKHRWVDPQRPFLVELGVMDAAHRLVPTMARKWKQINKFVEIFAHAFAESPLAARAASQPVRVLDFGAGKGYLTFAVHDHLLHGLQRQADVVGVELRGDLVALCNGVVQRLRLQGLRFDEGDIARRAPEPIDVMIALHACDTATDLAIHQAVRGGAAIILCAPCCHKQIRPQLLSPQPLRPILQHGVHLGQQAEMLTDGLRALLLEACGYDARVFEFISLEHTNKNKMILAVRRAHPKPVGDVLDQIREIKRFYGIRDQALETLLIADGTIPAF
ncbi:MULTISPECIES: SAM-dependent methyltransferase [Caldimonas]|uniref:class I SAM-dependent methyltransferase n=1 Tax=Caldimonas TaxID=196013 RepID=UPI00035CD887|nr:MULTISPECIES: SAM-dependent methyltransferase [Caldimonas]GIX24432.1 MAG: methyltransferase [Caldimonas sp.]